MKKILMLITILIMAIASCSSPTAIKNNGGGSDINDNTSTNPPAGNGGTDGGSGEGGSTGGDNNTGSDNNNGGNNGGSNGGNTGGDNNNGSTNPPTTGPSLEQKYKDLALRLAYVNENAVDRWYKGNDDTKYFEFKVNSKGEVEFKTGHPNVGYVTYICVPRLETPNGNHEHVYEKINNQWIKSYTIAGNEKLKNELRIILTDRNSNSVNNNRIMLKVEFLDLNNYSKIRVTRSLEGATFEPEDDDVFVGVSAPVELTLN